MGEQRVSTDGGAYIGGGVNISGDFVGRDKVIYNIAGNAVIEKLPVYVGVPSLPNHFVGREALVEKLGTRLLSGEHPALSADGLPGVGKTTLTINLAQQNDILQHFKDGVLWASLGTQPDVMSILARWARALEVDLSDLVTPEERAQAVQDAIGQRHLLLVIDDAWDVESARLLRCGGLNCGYVLTTRNQTIARDFAGVNQVKQVPVLDEAPAHQLLKTLAKEAYATDPVAAQRLVETVGRLPLAIELLGGYLAASRHRRTTRHREQALEDLTSPAQRLALATQRLGAQLSDPEVTLQATIALSLDELPKETVIAFHALGAFAPKPERFELDAALAITETEEDLLFDLADRNLLEMDEDESLALHQTIADAARTETPPEAIERHRDYYLALINENKEDWQRIEEVYGQVRWAWIQQKNRMPEDVSILKFVWLLHKYQTHQNLLDDFLRWSGHGLHLAEANGSQADVAMLLHDRGRALQSKGQSDEAIAAYERSLAIEESLNDQHHIATVLNSLGRTLESKGQSDEAIAAYERSLAISESLNDQHHIAKVFNSLGRTLESKGQSGKAIAAYERSLAISESLNDQRHIAMVLNNLGRTLKSKGQSDEAIAAYERSLVIGESLNDQRHIAMALNSLGRTLESKGQSDKAIATYERSLAIEESLNNQRGIAIVLNSLGRTLQFKGQSDKAIAAYERSLAINEQLGDQRHIAIVLNGLGRTLESKGQSDEAIAAYERCLAINEQLGDQRYTAVVQRGLARALNSLGRTLESKGQSDKAIAAYERCLAINEQLGDQRHIAMVLNSLGRL